MAGPGLQATSQPWNAELPSLKGWQTLWPFAVSQTSHYKGMGAWEAQFNNLLIPLAKIHHHSARGWKVVVQDPDYNFLFKLILMPKYLFLMDNSLLDL